MPLSPAARVAAYRARKKSEGLPDITRRTRSAYRKTYKRNKSSAVRPFVGCDGEGFGTDDLGRQNFMLFRMGDRELYTGKRLTSYELLDFICDHPRGDLLIGFSFGYDITMILRDIGEKQQRRLFLPKTFGAGMSPFVWYKEFDIDYLPRNYLRVRRVRVIRNSDGTERRETIKGSQRTIYETFGFFQKSFLKVCKEFGVGSEEEIKTLAHNKDRRGDFTEMSAEERDYCAMECRFLGELMEKLRMYCDQADIKPRQWSGAGKLASAMHSSHGTITAKEVEEHVPKEVLDCANMAYYGGRFEITRTGNIPQKVHEYDISSAYPARYKYLPCLLHGTWERATKKDYHNPDALFVASIQFKCAPSADAEYGQLGGFPIRTREGHLHWPLQGSGTYWSPEIRSAEKLGFRVQYRSGYVYRKNCECNTFAWVEEKYEYRKSVGKQGVGYPIKLGVNALYGLNAQRKGNGKFVNMVYAGLITAGTRATINDAIASAPRPGRIVMIATDGIYSLDPLPALKLSDKLGDWECQEMDGLFIVQPGLYWSPAKRKRKSRGLSGKFFEETGRTEGFEQAWRDFEAAGNSRLDVEFPKVSVPVPGFIGLKLAVSRNKPELAGTWVNETRDISFDYRNKRCGTKWVDGAIVTKPKLGGPHEVSIPHRDFLRAGGQEAWEEARLMLEEQPDYIDLGIPFKD